VRRNSPLVGIGFMLVGTVFFAMADALAKWLVTGYPVLQVAWLRSAMGLILIGGVALVGARTSQLRTERPGWHLFRGMLSVAVSVSMFYGLKHIALAEFVAIIFATPIFVALLSPWLLREPVPVRAWLAIVVGFIGILLVARPVPGHFHPAHLVTLGVAVMLSAMYLTARILSTTESALALNFHIYPLSFLVLMWPATRQWVTPDAQAWLLFVLLGVTATLALWLLIQAMRHAPPALVAPMDYVRLVWITLLGYFIFGELPDRITVCGIVLIVASGIYMLKQGRRPKTA
jgi:drug/metabolite transporter (DMT)-like permease